MSDNKKVALYRMVLPDHVCPYGVRAKELLDQAGIAYEEHILASREEVEAFKAEHGIATTPLIVIDGEPIGGSEALEEYLAGQSAY